MKFEIYIRIAGFNVYFYVRFAKFKVYFRFARMKL